VARIHGSACRVWLGTRNAGPAGPIRSRRGRDRFLRWPNDTETRRIRAGRGRHGPISRLLPEAGTGHPGRCRRRTARGVHPARRSAADAILDLLRGEYLLDLRYETWTAALQVGVHAELRELLRPLLHADGIDITHETGIRAACALLTIDEFDENAHFALIRHLAASGKRQAARAVAERYVGRLRSEFDEEPGSTLVELLDSLGPNVNKPLTSSSSTP
jgi:hypothetical protein